MKAVCWAGANQVKVETVPDPKILNPRDAILKITSTAICGSDLHIYGGYIPTVQQGGTLSVMGVYGGFVDKLPLGAVINKGLTMRAGQMHGQKYMHKLLDLVLTEQLDPSFVVTHQLVLEQAPHAYKIFQQKQDNCIKVVLKP